MRTRGPDDADYDDGTRLGLTMNVHVSADTIVEVTTFPEQGRATVAFEGSRRATNVTLFLDIVEVAQLRDLLTYALSGLTDRADSSDSAEVPAGDTGAVTTDRAA